MSDSTTRSEPTRLGTLRRPKLVIGVVTAAFFPALVTAMVAFFGAEEAYPVVGVVAIVVGATLTFLAFRWALSQRMVIEIDDVGIRELRGAQANEIAWSDEHDLWIDGVEMWATIIPVGTHVETTVTTPGGNRVFVGMAPGDTHNQIHRRSTAANLARVAQQLDADREASFGTLQLSRQHLSVNGHRYAIEEIQELIIRDGKLRLKLDGKWITRHRTRLRDIPNYPTLLGAFEYVRES